MPAKRKIKGPRPKHVPQRTCVACQSERAKRELLRVVRTPTGEIEIDLTGKKSGRGSYLCRRKACWDLAFKKKALEHALQTAISPEQKAVLIEFAEGLPNEE